MSKSNLQDRVDTPPFYKEVETVIPTRDIERLASDLLEACNDALGELIYDYDTDLSDYDRDSLTDDVLISLKSKING